MVEQIIEMQHLKFEEYNTFIHKHPVVISIPHSGIWIPPEMKTKLKKDLLTSHEEAATAEKAEKKLRRKSK